MPSKRKTVFVSYAHEDRRWVDELTKFLTPWLRKERVQLWEDSRIQAGENWRHEIQKSLDEATVVVLLVTKDFLASRFIHEVELPFVLDKARKQEIRLLWVAVGFSAVANSELAEFQAVNETSHPLDTLSRPERDKAMVAIAKTIADASTIGTFAAGLRIIDETTEPLQAALEGRKERVDHRFQIQAKYEPAKDTISFDGAFQTITAGDLDQLPDQDREFIADLEDSLNRNYTRWSNVRKGLGDALGALDSEVESQLKRLTLLICRDLNNILNFLKTIHRYDLEDHYGRYRYICQQFEEGRSQS